MPFPQIAKKSSANLLNHLTAIPTSTANSQTPFCGQKHMFVDDANPKNLEAAAERHEINQNPADFSDQHDSPKRNSGRTGPTSSTGRDTSARNATRHGLCATTLILVHENKADWDALLNMWLDGYQNPAEHSLLYSFVMKTAQAEWFRRRAQKEYDFFLGNHSNAPITVFEPHELKAFELVQRYLTTAERKFQRDYRMLEQHWKSHHKPQPERKLANKQSNPEPVSPQRIPDILFTNNETGESVDCEGNRYPPEPGYICVPIIPGVYDPDHPAYEGPPPK